LQELLQMKVRIKLEKVNLMQLRSKVIFQIAVNETKGMACSNYIDTICHPNKYIRGKFHKTHHLTKKNLNITNFIIEGKDVSPGALKMITIGPIVRLQTYSARVIEY